MAVLFPEPERPVTMITRMASRIVPSRPGSELGILFTDRAIQVCLVCRTQQLFAKSPIFQQTRHPRQSFKMNPGRLVRRYQEKEELRGCTVEGMAIDAIKTPPKHRNYAL